MRSTLPIFIFIGLALVATIGIVVMQGTVTPAVVAVNNSSADELPITVYETDYTLVFGAAAVLFILAGYFALRIFL